MTDNYLSWGRYPRVKPKKVRQVNWQHDLPDLSEEPHSILPYGKGRSYGDSCLNEDGTLLDVSGMNRFIHFDRENGVLRAEAGVTMAEILELIVPEGWFIPVSPGTKFVTMGGAIANDVHGKNHHVQGTFGRHMRCFELLRSNGERVVCTPTENADLFRATIGGMGLTGLIVWAEMTLKRIPTEYVDVESIQFDSIDAFFRLADESEHTEYTVSWLDCTAHGDQLGRGVFQRGDFYDPPLGEVKPPTTLPSIPVPFNFPEFTVNPLTIRAFNFLYYRKQIVPETRGIQHYGPFFYPLDIALDWYRVYGRSGFLQYQFVMPYEDGYEPVVEVFRRIVKSGQGSPLIVFKTFGDIESPGMMSFPRKGVTLAIDFPYRGQATLRLLDELDSIVMSNSGRLYPAKDARMSAETFRKSYPNWEDFAQYIDPAFSSSFWRRVTESP